METFSPASVAELADVFQDASRTRRRLEIRGGGSKADIGAPRAAIIVSTERFSGVIDYEPGELVLTAGAGTPLREIEKLVSAQHQMLAFEPWDHGPMFGRASGAATIGGIIAAGVSGSRRLTAGAARDHLLGFEAVSGRGERFIGGGKVVKNVTGYDLPKLVCGSWGRLALLTHVTLKVLPRPQTQVTLAFTGKTADEAIAIMARALGSQAVVAAAGHSAPITALRLEGEPRSVEARVHMLTEHLASYGAIERLNEAEAAQLWDRIQTASPLATSPVLWRVIIPASRAGAVVRALEPLDARWSLDWAGGLMWVACADANINVRDIATREGGHAMLVRAPAEARAAIPAQQPPAAGVKALEARIRTAFDPAGIFETNRFPDTGDAN